MKTVQRYTFILLLFICSAVAAQKKNNKIVYPFKKRFENIDTLMISGSVVTGKFTSRDTITAELVKDLAHTPFLEEDLPVEKYGVNNAHYISINYRGDRIALLACWDPGGKYFAVNISLDGGLKYHGLAIQKDLLYSFFDKIYQR